MKAGSSSGTTMRTRRKTCRDTPYFLEGLSTGEAKDGEKNEEVEECGDVKTLSEASLRKEQKKARTKKYKGKPRDKNEAETILPPSLSTEETDDKIPSSPLMRKGKLCPAPPFSFSSTVSLLPRRTLTIVNEYSEYSVDGLSFLSREELLSWGGAQEKKQERRREEGDKLRETVFFSPPLSPLEQQLERVRQPQREGRQPRPSQERSQGDFHPSSCSARKGLQDRAHQDSWTRRKCPSMMEDEEEKEKVVGDISSFPFNTVVELSGGCACCNLLPALARVLETAADYNDRQYERFLSAWKHLHQDGGSGGGGGGVQNQRDHQEHGISSSVTNSGSRSSRDDDSTNKRRRRERSTTDFCSTSNRNPYTSQPTREHSESSTRCIDELSNENMREDHLDLSRTLCCSFSSSTPSSSSSSSSCLYYDDDYYCYGYIFVECTGVGESLPIVAALLSLPFLRGRVAMDVILTVVDARSLLELVPPSPLGQEVFIPSRVHPQVKNRQGRVSATSSRTMKKHKGKKKRTVPHIQEKERLSTKIKGKGKEMKTTFSLTSLFTSTSGRRTATKSGTQKFSSASKTVKMSKTKKLSRQMPIPLKKSSSPSNELHTGGGNHRHRDERKPLTKRKVKMVVEEDIQNGLPRPLSTGRKKMPREEDVKEIFPFLISHGGHTRETLKGTNVVVMNAWEEAVSTAFQRLLKKRSAAHAAAPSLQTSKKKSKILERKKKKSAIMQMPPPPPPSLLWQQVFAHLKRLTQTLVRVSEAEAASIWTREAESESVTRKVHDAIGTPHASSVPSSSSAVPSCVSVKSFFTHYGDFSDIFFSQLYRKGLFEKEFLRGADGEEQNYFLKAYGTSRVAALHEGRFIALEKRKKKKDPSRGGAQGEEDDDDEEEIVEVNMAEEEARERKKLGLHQWIFQLSQRTGPCLLSSIEGEESSPFLPHSLPSSSRPLLRVSELKKTLQTSAGSALFRKVWRSKGFFYALDDDDDQIINRILSTTSHNTAQRQPQPLQESSLLSSTKLGPSFPFSNHQMNASKGERSRATSHARGTPTFPPPPSSLSNLPSVKQFRWQTVGRHVHYGEVLPPYVPLFSNEKREHHIVKADPGKWDHGHPTIIAKTNGEGVNEKVNGSSAVLKGNAGEEDGRRQQENGEDIALPAASSRNVLDALIVFLGNFGGQTTEEEEEKIQFENNIRSLFTSGTISSSSG